MSATSIAENSELSDFHTIGEVARRLDVPQHVIRFWETKFKQIKPVKRRGGHRYFRKVDVEFLAEIKSLLYEKGFTIKGAQKYLSEKQAEEPSHESEPEDSGPQREMFVVKPKSPDKKELKAILERLRSVRELLKKS